MSHYFFHYLYIYYLYSIPLGTHYIIHNYKLFVTQAAIFLYNYTIYMCKIVINARDSLYMYYTNYSSPRNVQTTTTILLLIIHFTLQLSGCDMYN